MTFDLTLDDLADPEKFAILHAVFHDPETLRRHMTREMLTGAKRTRQSEEIPHRLLCSTKIASQLTYLQTEGFGAEYLNERNKLIAAVTMEDAKRAVKRLFGDGKFLVTVAGQPEGM